MPAQLVKTIPLDRWRSILTHELAHLRRGDHWVSRLELAAGLVWWWNPVYWLARARLDAEAELACDAWVVWALPKERLAYAEILYDICATLSSARPPAPTLSVAGSGRFFERRLIMILHDHVPCRLTPAGFLGACVLLLFALPSWSAVPAALNPAEPAAVSVATGTDQGSDVDDDDEKKLDKKDDDADDDDDDDRPKAKARAKAKKSDPQDLDIDLSAIEKKLNEVEEIASKFGPDSDFAKKMEEFGEKFGKEIEAKFGPGSDFEKKMEAFGKEIEAKFGPGSDFEKRMEAFGKEIETKFGPGSDFEKKVKALGSEMKEKYGPGSEFANKVKKQSGASGDTKSQKKTSGKLSSSGTVAESGDAKPGASDRKRERRIQELEAQVRKLVDEIKALKSNDGREENEKK